MVVVVLAVLQTVVLVVLGHHDLSRDEMVMVAEAVVAKILELVVQGELVAYPALAEEVVREEHLLVVQGELVVVVSV